MAERLARLAIRFPSLVAAAFAVATAVAVPGLSRLESASYLEGHLPANDAELVRFRELEREFGSERVMLAAFGCGATRDCVDVFEPVPRDLLFDLEARAARHAGVISVASLASVGLLEGDGDDLHAVRLARGADAEAVARFRRLVENDPLVRGTLVSRDLRTAALVVRFDPTLPDAERNAEVLDLLAGLRTRSSEAGFTLHATGDAVFAAATDAYVTGDLRRLTPVMFLLIVLLLVAIFRALAPTLLALVAVGLPAVWVFGLMGWLGRPLTPVITTLPVLVVIVGVTDAIHFLVRVYDRHAHAPSRRDLVLDVVHEVGPPTSVTAVTSALGFLSFLAGPLPALREFGLFAAMGIIGAWLVTFTAIPIALIRLWLPRAAIHPPAFRVGDRALASVQATGHRRAGVVAVGVVGLAAAAAVGIARIVPETEGIKLIGEGDPLAVSERFVRTRLHGQGSIELVLELSDGVELAEPETLARLEAMERRFRARPELGPVTSILPVLRVANREVGDGSFALPDRREAASQLLLLAELADPETLRRLVTPDRRMLRMSVGSNLETVRDFRAQSSDLRSAAQDLLGDAGRWFFSGVFMLSLHQGDLVLQSQLSSFSTALASIFAVLLLFVRSLPLAALGMVPNALPVAAILGFMGFAGINLDVATAMIASILLGVSVDDTVYFLTHYRRARGNGVSVRDATAYTLAVAGKPAVFSALVLAAGFFVLGFSSFQSLAIFGMLSGVAVLGAAASELVVLPALLELVAARRERR